ncbi:MAG: SAM-dependent methyltransferase, partial [Hymenobacter sp.]
MPSASIQQPKPFSIRSLSKLNGFRHDGERYYFKPSFSWSKITSSTNTFRYYPEGFCFDSAGLCILGEDELDFELLGFLNSKVCEKILGILNPTLNASPGVIKKLPLTKQYPPIVKNNVLENISVSKLYWDSNEYSFNHTVNELIRIKGQDLEETYDLYQQYWKSKFFQLHKNEEELNRQFIEIY